MASYISSMASSSSLSAAASVPTPTGPASIFVQQGNHKIPIHLIKDRAHPRRASQGFLVPLAGDAAGGAHFGEIAPRRSRRLARARAAAAAAISLGARLRPSGC